MRLAYWGDSRLLGWGLSPVWHRARAQPPSGMSLGTFRWLFGCGWGLLMSQGARQTMTDSRDHSWPLAVIPALARASRYPREQSTLSAN